MVEIHPNPEKALSDGAQSLKLPKYLSMMKKIHNLQEALKKD
jgi:3-deoxy-7-phosphoheptulonate synthase